MVKNDLILDLSWIHQLPLYGILTTNYQCTLHPLLEDILASITIDGNYDSTWEINKGGLLEWFYDGGMSLDLILPRNLFISIDSEMSSNEVSDKHLELLEWIADLGEAVLRETIQQLRNTTGDGTYYLRNLTIKPGSATGVWKKDMLL